MIEISYKTENRASYLYLFLKSFTPSEITPNNVDITTLRLQAYITLSKDIAVAEDDDLFKYIKRFRNNLSSWVKSRIIFTILDNIPKKEEFSLIDIKRFNYTNTDLETLKVEALNLDSKVKTIVNQPGNKISDKKIDINKLLSVYKELISLKSTVNSFPVDKIFDIVYYKALIYTSLIILMGYMNKESYSVTLDNFLRRDDFSSNVTNLSRQLKTNIILSYGNFNKLTLLSSYKFIDYLLYCNNPSDNVYNDYEKVFLLNTLFMLSN